MEALSIVKENRTKKKSVKSYQVKDAYGIHYMCMTHQVGAKPIIN